MQMTDELRVRGVRSRGFGQLAKAAMLDSDLSLESRAILAYFTSYTGGGNTTAFPGRDKILADIGLNKDTYYKHFKALKEQGYITVTQSNGGEVKGYSHNIYTLENYPEKYEAMDTDLLSDYAKKAIEHIRALKDISAAGYGNVPKLVMTDNRLSIQARGAYAYLCVFAGENALASPDKETAIHHLKISSNSYSKYMKELEDLGYISRTNKIVNGRFGGIIFCLNPIPEVAQCGENGSRISYTKISDTVKSGAIVSDTIKQDNKISDTINSATNKNSSLSKTIINTTNINQSPEGEQGCKNSGDNSDRLIDGKDMIISYTLDEKAATDNIITKLEALSDKAEGENRDFYMLTAGALMDMFKATGKGSAIQGTHIPANRVFDAYVKFTGGSEEATDELIRMAMERYAVAAMLRAIKNPRQYLKSIIWTILTESKVKVPQKKKEEPSELPNSLRRKSKS